MTTGMSIAVIGGGVIGMCTALELAAAGARVTVVEADALGSGSSGRSVGVCGTQFTDPFGVLLRRHAFGRFRAWEEQGLTFNHIGYLRLARTEEQLARLERTLPLRVEAGFRSTVCGPADLARLVPDLSVDGLAGGSFGPDDGFLDPYELCTFLGARVRELGGEVRQQCRVTGTDRKAGGGYRLETTKGGLVADAVVNAAGAWAPRVAAMLGQDLHLHNERHEAVSVVLERPLPYTMPMVMDLLDGEGTGLNFRHEREGELISEIHKVDVAESADPDRYDETCSGASRDHLAALLLERLPGPAETARLGRGWAGLYPVTADGRPFAGPVDAGEPRLVTAAGGGGYGVQLAPVIGMAAADWVLHGGPASAPGTEPLAPTPDRNRPLG